METIRSSMNYEPFTIGQKLAAMRFIFMVPLGQMIHIKTLPPIVFDYIFWEGHLHDFPWVSFMEDDLGSSLARNHRHIAPHKFKEIITQSRVYKADVLFAAAREVWLGRMALGDLEAVILKYAYKHAYKHKDII